MRTATLKFLQLFLAGTALLLSTGCSDPSRVMDDSKPIADHNWSYVSPARFDVKIDDVHAAYNLYFNVRVTGDYKYSNLFVLLHTTGPDKKPSVLRYELKLASKDGAWLGNGSGNLYSFRISFKTNYHFPAAGVYHFGIEQNMRDNPLHEVSDVGIRVEKAE